eukprot:2824005-Pyramimonas_sp.AAC.1
MSHGHDLDNRTIQEIIDHDYERFVLAIEASARQREGHTGETQVANVVESTMEGPGDKTVSSKLKWNRVLRHTP